VEPIVLGVFILHFVLFVNYKDSEYFLFLRYLIPILLLTIVGYLTLPISGGFKLRNFGGTKLRITSRCAESNHATSTITVVLIDCFIRLLLKLVN
jgi:hypothetical protein